MIFTAQSSQALKFLAEALRDISHDNRTPLPLSALRSALDRLTDQSLIPTGDGSSKSLRAILATDIDEPDVWRVTDKLAVHRFLCQFPVEFDPVANIGVTTRDLIAALRQIAKKDEVSPRMAATLDGIEAGLGTVELDPIPLFEAGDKAFHFYKSLNDELAARWVLAKDCFVMRSLFERRARISDLHAKIVGAKRSSVAAEMSAGQTASVRPAAGPIVYQPQPVAEVTTVVVPQALVGTARAEDEFDLAAELERASVAANTARIGKGDGTVTDTLSPEEIAARHMELSQAFADSELDALDALTAELEEAVGWRR